MKDAVQRKRRSFMPGEAIKKFTISVTYGDIVTNLASPEFKDLIDKLKPNNFGIIGVGLSSFIYFSNIYYAYYMEVNPGDIVFNRHAILHGSLNSYNTKANALKLLTYLYLIVELEPVFEILFDES